MRVGRWLVGILADTNNNNNNGDVHDDGTLAREKGTNEGSRTRVRGWALMDFFTDPKDVDAGAGIVPLLVECNYRGRVDGEEGWIGQV